MWSSLSQACLSSDTPYFLYSHSDFKKNGTFSAGTAWLDGKHPCFQLPLLSLLQLLRVSCSLLFIFIMGCHYDLPHVIFVISLHLVSTEWIGIIYVLHHLYPEVGKTPYMDVQKNKTIINFFLSEQIRLLINTHLLCLHNLSKNTCLQAVTRSQMYIAEHLFDSQSFIFIAY